uniref:Uncharacterized protein n=1 Tax=Euplotes harpa TaxID=151035 RepID=A0A7S3JP67_9SPIT|mmetsp:Transcript_9477/g.10625  ORF Transcript_9477/g.10625 Transcript_9477/m.10625 type:complete len:240 (+) Transcript_9477:1010-1729(+)
MFIIIRDGGLLKDKHGRLVNTRGYLIDNEGNVIHQNGTKIFNKDELDENNEIPAPFLLDEKEFGLIPMPELIPKKLKNAVKKPPRPSYASKFSKKEIQSNISKMKPSSRESKRSKDTKSNLENLSSTFRKQSSNLGTRRPATTKQKDKRKPMVGNFTEDKTIDIKEEGSELDSVFGIERVPISKKQNLFKNESSVDQSEFKDTKEKLSDGFFMDYLLNNRPEYYGDTSDILSRSRKLYY